jgi:hypothetical protein
MAQAGTTLPRTNKQAAKRCAFLLVCTEDSAMSHEIEFDEFVLMVEITDLTNIKGDFKSWDSPEDYHGCRELEFNVISGVVCDEDGNATDLGRNGCAAVAERHAELIEEKLWQIVDDEAENAALERAEAKADRITEWRAA